MSAGPPLNRKAAGVMIGGLNAVSTRSKVQVPRCRILSISERMAVDKSENRVRRMFGEIAGRYDFLNHLLSLGIDHYWRGAPSAACRRGTMARSWTYAPARGTWRGLPGASGGTAQVVGADFCHEMLVIGRAKAQRAGANGQLGFLEADAQNLPLPDDYFQIVCVAFGQRERHRYRSGTARDGARLPEGGARSPCWNSRSRAGNRSAPCTAGTFAMCSPRSGRRSRNRLDAYNYLPESVGEFPSGEALAERMGAAGLAMSAIRP